LPLLCSGPTRFAQVAFRDRRVDVSLAADIPELDVLQFLLAVFVTSTDAKDMKWLSPSGFSAPLNNKQSFFLGDVEPVDPISINQTGLTTIIPVEGGLRLLER
jgi:hypothetical protein